MKKYFPAIRHEIDDALQGDRITAVYFLIKKGVIVYIGKTQNLKTRISIHKSSLYVSKWFDSFRFIRCSSDDLGKYERRWIRKFQPKENYHKYARTNYIYSDY